MGTPTRFTYGLATVTKQSPLGNYPLPDPFHTGSTPGLDVFTYQTDYTDLGQTASFTVTGATTDPVNSLSIFKIT